MRVRGVSWLKMVVLVVATLLAIGTWGVYTGEQALAQPQPELSHFKCYQTSGPALNEPVRLGDQFHPISPPGGSERTGGEAVTVKGPHFLCTPVFTKCRTATDGTEICEDFPQPPPPLERRDHLNCYKLAPSGPPVNQEFLVVDQFDDQAILNVGTAQLLCAPASKGQQPG